jgi:hypothetical protein
MPTPRPLYSVLQRNYPDPRNVPIEELFQWIGHADKLNDANWHNTCAIRVSLALLGAGMIIPGGFLHVKAGKFKDRTLEIGQEALAALLTREWGEPEKFPGALARESIGHRNGVARFIQLWGPFDPQGHIDLVDAITWNQLACQGTCYWDAVEVWFWELR